MALANRAGLHVIDIQKTPIHGNSYMFVLSKNPGARLSVQHQIDQEREQGLQDLNTYLIYAEKCHQVVKDLNDVIKDYRSQGYVIAGYGAAAKGNTLLNFGHTYLDFIIDDNPLKQGLFAPGSNIPVVPIDFLDQVADMKVAFVPLAWNFFKEISSKIKAKRSQEGDIFVRYFPKIKVE